MNDIIGSDCQVQAVLLLLGGRDIPTAVPTIEVQYDQNNRVILCFWVIKSNAIASRAYISCIFVIFSREWVTPQSAQIFHEE